MVFTIVFHNVFLDVVEAVLGKSSDTNLEPTMITIHMLVGLLVIGIILRLLFIVTEES